ncbi:helix-turn-helix domain-containing protein [Frisingicoccus sp.]|uniref:helix-turn-helix domain-containing protein n=1 Tax=Frisingicoccus sp. TaxID=1918627 RepID=UPI0025BD9C91|nr:helix-turn-helix transcriptional regulator [Frisingicoccus sp.]
MTDSLFAKLWKDALDQSDKELYIAEYGYPEWFDEISEDPDVVVDTLGNIHDVASMSVKDMVKKSGMSQAKFAEKFCIPKRTVESWCMGERSCPDYVRLMMARLLGYLQ